MNFGFDLAGTGAQTAILMLVKLLFIIGGALYFAFAFVVIRQISVMKRTLITPLNWKFLSSAGYTCR